MKTKIKFIRFVFAFMLALSVLGVSTSAALADKPVIYEFMVPDIFAQLTDICPFPIDVYSTINVMGIDYVDKSGVVTNTFWHFVTQDRIEANGKTLFGAQYRYNIFVLWDNSDPNNQTVARMITNGVVEKMLLPGGGIFNPAGRTDLSATPFATFLTPDHGNVGNISGLCEALEP
jgi:hypothetical protein